MLTASSREREGLVLPEKDAFMLYDLWDESREEVIAPVCQLNVP